MNSKQASFDPIWEERYQNGYDSRYPWDSVVSFVYRHYPQNKSKEQIEILEVGCGTASNLWFVAKEGFRATGIDCSPTAIASARKRFADENLTVDLQVGDFTHLPFLDNSFDMVIDRGALTCCGLSAAHRAIREIHRVLIPGGTFFFNPCSDRCGSYVSGKPGEDGLTHDISAGLLANTGQICFYGRNHLQNIFVQNWNVLSVQHVETTEQTNPTYFVHAEWRVIARKIT